MSEDKMKQDDVQGCTNSCPQSYTGIKQVKAFPYGKKEAEVYLGREIKPAKEGSDEGYIVIYEDGYESWCPKDVFEKANRKCETYMERLLIEREDLGVKVLKLTQFVYDVERERLAKRAEHHLDLQLKAMNQYLSILNERINPNEGCEGNTCCGDPCKEGE